MRRIFNKIASSISRFLYFIRRGLKIIVNFTFIVIDQILGTVPNLVRANRIIEKKLRKKQEEGILTSDPRLKLTEDEVKEVFEVDLRRLERIEEKARATVIGVTLAVSLASPGILLFVQPDIMADEPLSYRRISAAFFVVAILFLAISGYLSLSAYKVGQIMRPRLEDSKILTSVQNALEVLLMSRDYNVLRILQKANLFSASMDCLRNGLFLLLIFIVLSVISALK